MRPIIGIIGDEKALPNSKIYEKAIELGDLIVSAGYRIITDNSVGISEAICMGGMNSESYFEGSIICVLDKQKNSNKYCDIKINVDTDGEAARTLILTSEIIIAIGGGNEIVLTLKAATEKRKTIIYFPEYCEWLNELYNLIYPYKLSGKLIPANSSHDLVEMLLKKL